MGAMGKAGPKEVAMNGLSGGNALRTEVSKRGDCKGHRTNIPGDGIRTGRGPEAGRGKAPGENHGDSSEGRGRYEVRLVAPERPDWGRGQRMPEGQA